MNNIMGKCPQVIKQFPAHVHDVLGNTTATSDGTVLKLHCYYGYRLSGYNVVKCRKGRWVPEVSACAKIQGLALESKTTNPYLVPTNYITSTVSASPAQSGENFQNYWGVTRDDMILILSICLAVAFVLLVILIIVLAYYHRRRRRFWDDHRRRVTTRRMAGRRPSKALLPMDKRRPPWLPHHPVPSIYMRPSGRPMYYPTYDYRWQHMPGRPQQLGYPFLVYHPHHQNAFALEDNTQYTWNTNKTNQLRRNNGQKFPLGDGRASETESIEVVWDAERMAWLDELEYTDSKIPRPSLNTDKADGAPQQLNGGLRNADDIPVISVDGQDTSPDSHLF